MKTTIDGRPYTCQSTRDRGIRDFLFTQLEGYNPDLWGQVVQIEPEHHELFDVLKFEKEPDIEMIPGVMKTLADEVNVSWQKHVKENEETIKKLYGVSTPPPFGDMRLKVCSEMRVSPDGEIINTNRYVFIILMPPWLGVVMDIDEEGLMPNYTFLEPVA